MEAAAHATAKSATMAAAAEPAAMTAAATAAVTAATATTSAATRQRGIGLDHRQNRRERGDGNAHAACDADEFHSPPTPTDRRRSDGCERIILRRDRRVSFTPG
jgi:hypothetical protein